MTVICDTSALNALLGIDQLRILGNLYGQIIMPPKVYEELLPLAEMGIDIAELDSLTWLNVRHLTNFDLFNQLMADLDEGAAQAISLAVELKADWLIIDELDGKRKSPAAFRACYRDWRRFGAGKKERNPRQRKNPAGQIAGGG